MSLQLVIGDRVALVAGNKVYRGIVDCDQNRVLDAQWFIKLEVVEPGEPTEVQIYQIAQPEIGVCATPLHSGDNHPRQSNWCGFHKGGIVTNESRFHRTAI